MGLHGRVMSKTRLLGLIRDGRTRDNSVENPVANSHRVNRKKNLTEYTQTCVLWQCLTALFN
jgi:hypothetical protein